LKYKARVLSGGDAQGPLLLMEEPLSFWGAFDPRTGVIVDAHHPQRGACLTGRVLLMRETRGSGSAPGALAEAIRLDTAPSCIILASPDINLAVGSEVAATLYGRRCPIVLVEERDYERLKTATHVAVSQDGTVTAD
jgi:predicted aconitase with swiveling domain